MDYIKKVITWWVGLSSDYRTTPVNIVQLCIGLGCGNKLTGRRETELCEFAQPKIRILVGMRHGTFQTDIMGRDCE